MHPSRLALRAQPGGSRRVGELSLAPTGIDQRQSPSVLSNSSSRLPDVADDFLSAARNETVRILVYMPGGNETITVQAYGEYITSLLHGQATYKKATSRDHVSSINQAASSCDLIMFGRPEQSRIERLLYGSACRRVVSKASKTILLVKQPKWPIRKILFVLRVDASEELAVDWTGRLTRFSGAKLTILPLVPSQSLLYGSGSHLQIGIESLLAPNTPSGVQLRRFLNRLGQWQVNGVLRVRQGDPLWQVLWEFDRGNYDLVIIGAEQHSRWQRWLFGGLVGPVVSRINRPILIASTKQLRTPYSDHEQEYERGER